jgi:hypothetical protein
MNFGICRRETGKDLVSISLSRGERTRGGERRGEKHGAGEEVPVAQSRSGVWTQETGGRWVGVE